MGEWGALGVSFTSFYMDEMEITTVYNSEGTGEYYDAGDLAVGLSYARSLTDRFTFGITVKYVREFIWNESASQMAVDVGSLYRTDFMNLRLGMAVRNFGGKMKFSGEDIDQRLQEELDRQQDNNPRVERLSPEFRLPQVFQMGLAFDPVESENARLTLLADVDVPSDNTQRMIVAAEFNFRDLAYLRGGYRFNYDEGALSLGGGLYINAGGLMTRLDYAFSARGVFGNVHQFGLGFSL
jgi:hypothetical protein